MVSCVCTTYIIYDIGRALKEKEPFLKIKKFRWPLGLNGLAISGGTFFAASLSIIYCYTFNIQYIL